MTASADPAESFSETDLYVSPAGDDDWSGEHAEPTGEGDGPFATIERARDAVRERKRSGDLPDHLTVWIRGGRYAREEPLRFGPGDTAPVTYRAYPGEEPVLSGGRAITGWEETIVDGVEAWTTTIPAVAEGEWYFRQLFVDGERKHRPRLPGQTRDLEGLGDDDFYWIRDVPGTPVDAGQSEHRGVEEFDFAGDDLEDWHNVSDVEVVVLHRWIEERLPIESVDEAAGTVHLQHGCVQSLTEHAGHSARYARYYVENVFEALSEPGEWYLDRESGECYYIPEPGETIEDVEAYAPAPGMDRVLHLDGDATENDRVEFLGFEGITVEHTERWTGPEPDTYVQSASYMPGAITITGARNVAIENCTVRHTGMHGVELGAGCRGDRVVGCDLHDLGAGGVKANGYSPGGAPPKSDDPADRTGDNAITDNHVHHGGRIFHRGVGILAMHVFDTEIAHNHVHDFFYTGVNCGWTWQYQTAAYDDCVEADNRVAHNHIHDLGHGVLSDMGGIYTLGVQSGTVLRGNRIHDVSAWNYGGWGIYPDQASSHVVIEDNVVFDTEHEPFGQHWGRENVVRNNVFALGGAGQVELSRAEDHVSYTFERNVVVADGAPLFTGGYGWDLEPGHVLSDLNLLWDASGDDLLCGHEGEEQISLAEWRDRGHDRHSVVADPGFVNLDARDFGLDADSPATEVGFDPGRLDGAGEGVGPRPPEAR